MTAKIPSPVGAKVVAARDVGPVRDGACGITTGLVDVPFLWWSLPMYLCTFSGNVKLAVWPNEIDEYDHGYTLAS